MRILVVEDEIKVAENIKLGLEEQSYIVNTAHDGYTGKKLALENEYDVILIDVILPLINGYDLCKQLRLEKVKAPILLLTALGTVDDKINGFDSGADDYLVKPFDFRELIARIKALYNRREGSNIAGNILSIADLEMNLDEKSVKRSGKRIELTAKEFLLLEFLIKNKGRVISRSDIAEKVWDISFDTGTNVIDVYVTFLRKKIDKEFSSKLIHTVKGMGYILKIEE